MSSRGSELEAGAMIGGYRIDYLISRGGMGVVYRASNLALNRIYALKVLAPELADDDQFRERFRREIRLAASLHHPNVVAIHYAGEHDGMLFLAMDLIDGTDLRQVIMRSGALHPERAVELLAQITSALDAAHRKGLVHRDVKPANVLISVKDCEEHAYLTDFGLAKRFDNATALTVKGDVVGTVDYMPPEQITGNRTDARSDIYALGCVLFQMLTGKVPYHREHSVATLFAHVYEPPPSLEGPIAASHPTLGPVIAKAMAKDPADRHLSAGALHRHSHDRRDRRSPAGGRAQRGGWRTNAGRDRGPTDCDGATARARGSGSPIRPGHQDPRRLGQFAVRRTAVRFVARRRERAADRAQRAGDRTAPGHPGDHGAPERTGSGTGPRDSDARERVGDRCGPRRRGDGRGSTGTRGRRRASSTGQRIVLQQKSLADRCGPRGRCRRGRRGDRPRLELQTVSHSPGRRAICDAA